MRSALQSLRQTDIISLVVFFLLWLLIGVKQYLVSVREAQLLCACGIVMICGAYALANLGTIFRTTVLRIVFGYAVYIAIISAITIPFRYATVLGFFDVSLFPFVFIFFFIFAKKHHASIGVLLLIAWCIATPFALWNALRWRELIAHDMVQSNAGNYLACLLPFVFLVKHRTLRTGMLLLSASGILLSLKRSAAVLWCIAVIYELSFYKSSTRRELARKIVGTFIAVVALGVGTVSVSDTEAFARMEERISELSEDGGSGRVDIFAEGIRDMFNRDFQFIVFGEGPYGNLEFISGDRRLRYAFHNDVLEIFRVGGVFGALLFVSMWLVILRMAWKARRARVETGSAALFSALLIILGMPMFSPVVAFVTYAIPAFAILGGSLGFYEKMRLSWQEHALRPQQLPPFPPPQFPQNPPPLPPAAKFLNDKSKPET